jgi:hypothetical protein
MLAGLHLSPKEDLLSRIHHRFLKKKSVSLDILALATLASLFIAGCGSSGGGDGGGGGTSGLSYSGLTSAAIIEDTNASELAANAYSSGNRGLVFGALGGAAFNGPDPQPAGPGRLLMIDIIRIFHHSLEDIDFSAAAAQNSASTLYTAEDTISGACGGHGSYAIQVNDATGVFSGSLTFSSYCEEDISINGKTTFSGTVNLDTEELESFSMRFDSITGTSRSESFTLDGDVDVVVGGVAAVMTMDMLIKDNALDKVYRIEDYHLTVSEEWSYTSVQASGRFYDPDYGYVTLSTESPLLIHSNDDYPASGRLVLTGKIGSDGGPTRARLTALSADTCQVEADTDGDGSYNDYDSGVIFWDDLGD